MIATAATDTPAAIGPALEDPPLSPTSSVVTLILGVTVACTVVVVAVVIRTLSYKNILYCTNLNL